jgi:hypothetical protein
MVVRTGNKSGSIGGFFKRTQRTLLDTPWQIIQVMETGQPGNFNVPKLILFDITLQQICLVNFWKNGASSKFMIFTVGFSKVHLFLKQSHVLPDLCLTQFEEL